MKTLSLILIAGLCTVSSLFAQTLPTTGAPATPKRPVTDIYFGKAVVDNYRWLEDMNSDETKAWFKAQGDYTNAVLDQIPGRDKLIQQFAAYDKLLTVRYGEIKRRGNRYFYRRTLPSEKAGKLYVREGKTGKETLLFDPLAYETGKTYLMTAFTPNSDGKKLTIGLQEGGAELSTVRTMDVATRTFGPESITAVFGGEVSWLPDDSGFLYTPNNSMDTKDPKGNLNTKGRLHKLGNDPATNPDLFSIEKNPDFGIKPDQYPVMFYSDDNTQVYGYLGTVDRRATAWVAPASDVGKPTIGWKRVCAVTDSVNSFVKLGDRLFMQSVKGAPNGQILVTDAANPNPATATVLLPEGKQNITRMASSKDFLFVTLSDGINEKIRQYDSRTNQWADVPIPGTGTLYVEPLDASRSNEILAYIVSWNNPGTRYDYDPETRRLVTSTFHVPMNYPGVADLVVEEVEISSHDGTMIPLSIIYRKGLKRDGSAACLMNGYGAYGVSAIPRSAART